MASVSSGTSETSRRKWYGQRSGVVTPGGGEELLDLEKSLGGEGKRGVSETVVRREVSVTGRNGKERGSGRKTSKSEESEEGILVVQTFEMSGR